MKTLSEPRRPQSDEREIRALSDQSGAPLAHVRDLFGRELARLQMGAKVGSYLGVLTASSVRGMLRRKARLAEDVAQLLATDERIASRMPQTPTPHGAEQAAGNAGARGERRRPDPQQPQAHLRRWEDDGGSGTERATVRARTARRAR